jgi:threonine/homoserine/homoserine lactone efflux protein
VDEDEGISVMTVTGRVIIAVCWMVLALLGIDYPNRHRGIVITALVVIGVVLLAEWWRWSRKSSEAFGARTQTSQV